MERVILDLCAGTGSWSKPYLEAGYKVVPVTLPDDVRLWQYHDKVHGVLAAPPCTVFSRAGQWVKRSQEEMLEAIGVVDACLRLVVVCRPEWWALENPVGTLRRGPGEAEAVLRPLRLRRPVDEEDLSLGRVHPAGQGPRPAHRGQLDYGQPESLARAEAWASLHDAARLRQGFLPGEPVATSSLALALQVALLPLVNTGIRCAENHPVGGWEMSFHRRFQPSFRSTPATASRSRLRRPSRFVLPADPLGKIRVVFRETVL